MGSVTASAFLAGLSPQAREALETQIFMPSPAPPSTAEGWLELQAEIEERARPACDDAVQEHRPKLSERTLGGMTAVEIDPVSRREGATPILFLHGGAYTGFSARSTLFATVPLAVELERPVLSLDYPLAPRHTFEHVVTATAEALSDALRRHPGSALIGDSAGGGLALAATSRLLHEDGSAPAALVLFSPWTDLRNHGDSRTTLADHDPLVRFQPGLAASAAAYAPGSAGHPEASPVHADYDERFPPALVVCGTREILLSDSVRLYQGMRAGGARVVLDVYDGLHHSFPTVTPNTPEASDARRAVRAFLENETR